MSGPPASRSIDERFVRFSSISWWDQARLASARVLVVGAGALGNEVLKNLALLGVGNVCIIDLDAVDRSNLCRSVLFREQDCGRPKAVVAAERLREIYPPIAVTPIRGDVRWSVGLGLFRWADVVIGALDNREARLAVDRMARLADRPWVDGGIEALSGVARAFVPGDGPCYACTMSAEDWKLIDLRRACSLLPRNVDNVTHTPTTPTSASIIAGVQCTEALKLIHGLPALEGEGFVFNGQTYEAYRVRYKRDVACFNHERLPVVDVLDLGAADLTAGRTVVAVRERLGSEANVESLRDLVGGLQCTACGVEWEVRCALDSLPEHAAGCRSCGNPGAPVLYRRLDLPPCPDHVSLSDLGIPLWDVVVGRSGDRARAFELGGDRRHVLGLPRDARR